MRRPKDATRTASINDCRDGAGMNRLKNIFVVVWVNNAYGEMGRDAAMEFGRERVFHAPWTWQRSDGGVGCVGRSALTIDQDSRLE